MEFCAGLIIGVIIAFTYIYFFGDDNTYIDEAEARNVELARALNKIENENKKQERFIKELNNKIADLEKDIKLIEKNYESKIVDLENDIELLVNNNKNKKIKELISDTIKSED